MSSSIAIMGTCDTKGEEMLYLKRRLLQNGISVIIIDTSLKKFKNSSFVSDYSSDNLFDPSVNLDSLQRPYAVKIMSVGVRRLISSLYQQNMIKAIVGLGGSSGTQIFSEAVSDLPFGFPKVLLTTIQQLEAYVGTRDLIVFFPIADLAGGSKINSFERRVLENAATTICALSKSWGKIKCERSKTVAATMFGVTTPCVRTAMERFQNTNFDFAVFAAGPGGSAMEELIIKDEIDGVLDITTHELADQIVGGVVGGSQLRLEGAGKVPIPRVVSTGALDMVNFWGLDTIPEKFKNRLFYLHNSNVTLMRTLPSEAEKIAKRMGEKLAKAPGKIVVMIPLKGFSAYDCADGPNCVDYDGKETDIEWFSPDYIDVFSNTLKKSLGTSNVLVEETNYHINDHDFASKVAEILLENLSF